MRLPVLVLTCLFAACSSAEPECVPSAYAPAEDIPTCTGSGELAEEGDPIPVCVAPDGSQCSATSVVCVDGRVRCIGADGLLEHRVECIERGSRSLAWCE